MIYSLLQLIQKSTSQSLEEAPCLSCLHAVKAKFPKMIKSRPFQENYLKIKRVDVMRMLSFWGQDSLDWVWQFDSSSKGMKASSYSSSRQILEELGVTTPTQAVL